jgi:hypothetical protein
MLNIQYFFGLHNPIREQPRFECGLSRYWVCMERERMGLPPIDTSAIYKDWFD